MIERKKRGDARGEKKLVYFTSVCYFGDVRKVV